MSLINREDLIAEYDRVHVGAPGGARKLMVDAPEVKPDRDAIWDSLSKVYNMKDVPDEAKSIIGDLMLSLDGGEGD